MELHEALSQIAEIRARVAATEHFRGYRAVPVGAAGLLALVAGVGQAWLVPDPVQQLTGYLSLWLTVALVSLLVAAVGIWLRHRRGSHPLNRELTTLAVAQFAPALAVGTLVTLVVARHAPDLARWLPGLWQLIFSLGIFASCRLLPRSIVLVAVFYLLAGTVNLIRGSLDPWAMALPFGLGQLGIAAILYWTLERSHDDTR